MNGIRIRWTRQRDEQMESYLTFDQVRAHFGLVGTPDDLVRKRMGQTATTSEVVNAAEVLGKAKMITWSTSRVPRIDIRETDKMPEHEPAVCCTCKRPL